MNTLAKTLGALFVMVLPLVARQKTDLIVMANGDRITGEIKGLNGGVLSVSLDYVDGNIAIQWSKVARVESNQLFIVQSQDGALNTGSLQPSEIRATAIEVAGPQGTTTMERSDVVSLEETADTFLQRLSGEIDLGFLYTKGNDTVQNNFGSLVEYRRERWALQASYNSSLSSSTGSETSTRNQIDLTGQHLLSQRNWYYAGYGTFLQSSVQGIDLQTTLGGGIGRYLKNTNRTRFSLLGGMAWQSTAYLQSDQTTLQQNVGAGLFASDLRVFIFKKTNLSIRVFLLPSLREGGRVRFNTNATYYLKLFKNLSWNYSFYGNWDTQPPPNFAGTDYGHSSGLKWTFGYR